MDFDLNGEQRLLKQSVHDFLVKECPKELVRELDESDEGYSPELWGKMAELGWMGLVFPEEYGGLDFSFFELIILLEEMGYNICPGPLFSTVVLGGLPILTWGNEEQKKEFLPKIASGDMKLTLALTEQHASYDVSSIRAEAVFDNGEYVINGAKLFVPDATVVDYFLCVVKTNEGKNAGEGVTIFLVDSKSPGIKCTLLKTLSRNKQCEVLFDNVRVPEDNILGEPDRGWLAMKDLLEKAAVARCAKMVGGAQAVFDMSLQHAKRRIQFNRPIGSFQAVQHHMANMWIDVHTSRNMLYKTAWKISERVPASLEVAMTKVHISDACRRVSVLGHDILGAISFTMEHDMHLYYRRAKEGELAFGDADFQRKIVARELGL
ncbi:MAG: acyl-CoA/acyl-ACP dehydrogenase [Deltaproteobacteria bacterium]|nr:acyl-CoA/acyl-ACP dehydrogenase [Deltaproteobacteria bacterium]